MANNTEQLRDIFVKHFNLFEQGFYLTFTKCREKLLAEVEEWHEAEATRRVIEELEQIRINNELTRIGKEEIGARIAELKRQAEGETN